MLEYIGRWGEKQKNSDLSAWAKIGLKLNKGKEIPFPETKPATLSALEKEWKRQVNKYLKLGFHKELNLSKEAYRNSLPKFAPQPESYKGRFDIPVLVETRIPVKRQAEFAGLFYYLGGLRVRDWENDPKGYRTLETPYVTWMQDGRGYLNWKVEDFRTGMAPDERGATEFDGVALYIKNPRILQHHSIDLPGTSVGSTSAAYLGLG